MGEKEGSFLGQCSFPYHSMGSVPSRLPIALKELRIVHLGQWHGVILATILTLNGYSM